MAGLIVFSVLIYSIYWATTLTAFPSASAITQGDPIKSNNNNATIVSGSGNNNNNNITHYNQIAKQFFIFPSQQKAF